MLAKKGIHISGTGGDFGQIQAGFDIQGRQQIKSIFRGYVPCCALNKGATTHAGKGRIEMGNPAGHGRHNISQPEPARIVKVQNDRKIAGGEYCGAKNLVDRKRCRHSGGI